jgi:hypothetical protein
MLVWRIKPFPSIPPETGTSLHSAPGCAETGLFVLCTIQVVFCSLHSPPPGRSYVMVIRTPQQLQSVAYWEQSQHVVLEEKVSRKRGYRRHRVVAELNCKYKETKR